MSGLIEKDRIVEEQALAELIQLEELSRERRRLRGMDFYVPNKNQLKAHQSKAKTIIYIGGNRAGKSTFGCLELCFHLTKQYPPYFPEERKFKGPIKAVISTQSFPIIARVIEPKIKEYLPRGDYRVEKVSGKYLSRVIFNDGSIVDILNLEMKDEAYESADWDFAWLDEPHTRAKYQGIRRGLVDRAGQCVMTLTPLSEPWIKEELVDKADSKRIEAIFANTRDNKFDIKGNPILTEESIKEFEDSLPEEIRETRIDGKFFHLRGIVYRNFTQHHLRDFKYEYPDPVICVLDPHDRTPHHLIWAYIDKNDDIFVDFEWIGHVELPDLSRVIKMVEKRRGYKMKKRIIDPNFGRKPYKVGSNLSVIQELGKCGVMFTEGCDDVELGHMVVREYLDYDRRREVTAFNKPKLFFSRDRAVQTARSVRNLQYDEWSGKAKSEKDPRETEKQFETHGADCVRYLSVGKPKYRTLKGGVNDELSTKPY